MNRVLTGNPRITGRKSPNKAQLQRNATPDLRMQGFLFCWCCYRNDRFTHATVLLLPSEVSPGLARKNKGT